MRGGTVLKLVVLAAIGAAIAAAIKSLRGEPAPVFSNHPTVTGGPPKVTTLPPSAPEPEPDPEPDLDPVPEPVVPVAAPAPAPEPVTPSTTPAWVLPVEGACPEGFPVKAKNRSGIYHLPGSSTYERTNPDRCYPDEAAAVADGLRPPKR
jgi:hypothetical protein